MSDSTILLTDIEAYIAASGIAPSTFGFRAVNDGKLVSRLRGGSSVTLRNAEKIREFMVANPVSLAATNDEPEAA